MLGADVLFAQHRDGVFRYLCRVVGRTEDARDLTQEVFLRVARAGAAPPPVDAERAWLFTIARNLALNHVRDSRRRPMQVDLVDRPGAATQELAAALRQALATLADLDRDVFLLRESVGLSYEEIAEACAITPDAVRSRLHRARQQLRAILTPGNQRTGELT